MSTTVNFTASLDKDLLKRAKVVAAKADTSVNALLNLELRFLVESYENSEQGGNHNYKTLVDFSLGRIDDTQAMAILAVASLEDLFRLLSQAHLPTPKLGPSDTQKIVDDLHKLTI